MTTLDAYLGPDGSTRVVLPLPLSEDGTPPTELRLFGAGWNFSTKGRFHFTREIAANTVAELAVRRVEKVADYNHASIPQEREDGTVRQPSAEEGKAAARYLVELRDGPVIGEDGKPTGDTGPELWATAIKWTPEAHRRIAAKEYFQTSAAFNFDEKTGAVKRYVNFALVTDPAMFGLPALVAASAKNPTERLAMKMPEALAGKLKALMEADYEDEPKCMAALKGFMDETFPPEKKPEEEERPPKEMAALVALSGKSTPGEALAVFTAWQSGTGQIAALSAQIAERDSRLAGYEKQVALSAFDAKIAAAEKARKLSPADLKGETPTGKAIQTWRDKPAESMVLLNALVDALPERVPTAAVREPEAKVLSLNEEEKAIDAIFERGRPQKRPA